MLYAMACCIFSIYYESCVTQISFSVCAGTEVVLFLITFQCVTYQIKMLSGKDDVFQFSFKSTDATNLTQTNCGLILHHHCHHHPNINTLLRYSLRQMARFKVSHMEVKICVTAWCFSVDSSVKAATPFIKMLSVVCVYKLILLLN